MSKALNIAPLAAALFGVAVQAGAQQKPNVVLIIADDFGYSDWSGNPHHSSEVNTPNLERLMRGGVFCTDGYVTAHISSATRAGLMTGMYQQRFGIYTAGEGGSGLDMNARIFPQYLKDAGYVTGQFGKWHLGPTIEWSPFKRGFDYQYGFLGRGAHDYFRLNDPDDPIYRNDVPVNETGYLTDRLAEEVCGFIEKNKNKPFFAYLAFNAVHTPIQAPKADIARYNTGDTTRNTLMAMGWRMDVAIGAIMEKLKKEKIWDNTIIFFISDNGGALPYKSQNKPLNGGKHTSYEGGIRIPFIVSWPARLKPGVCHNPVIALDILPTVLAAVGIPVPKGTVFDGRDIMPFLLGKEQQPDREFFWCGGSQDPWWAVRKGEWKVVSFRGTTQLFNLREDVSEKNDLAAVKPDMLQQLSALHDGWLAQMKDPVSADNNKKWTSDAAPRQKKNQR